MAIIKTTTSSSTGTGLRTNPYQKTTTTTTPPKTNVVPVSTSLTPSLKTTSATTIQSKATAPTYTANYSTGTLQNNSSTKVATPLKTTTTNISPTSTNPYQAPATETALQKSQRLQREADEREKALNLNKTTPINSTYSVRNPAFDALTDEEKEINALLLNSGDPRGIPHLIDASNPLASGNTINKDVSKTEIMDQYKNGFASSQDTPDNLYLNDLNQKKDNELLSDQFLAGVPDSVKQALGIMDGRANQRYTAQGVDLLADLNYATENYKDGMSPLDVQRAVEENRTTATYKDALDPANYTSAPSTKPTDLTDRVFSGALSSDEIASKRIEALQKQIDTETGQIKADAQKQIDELYNSYKGDADKFVAENLNKIMQSDPAFKTAYDNIEKGLTDIQKKYEKPLADAKFEAEKWGWTEKYMTAVVALYNDDLGKHDLNYYLAQQGLTPEKVSELEKQYGSLRVDRYHFSKGNLGGSADRNNKVSDIEAKMKQETEALTKQKDDLIAKAKTQLSTQFSTDTKGIYDGLTKQEATILYEKNKKIAETEAKLKGEMNYISLLEKERIEKEALEKELQAQALYSLNSSKILDELNATNKNFEDYKAGVASQNEANAKASEKQTQELKIQLEAQQKANAENYQKTLAELQATNKSLVDSVNASVENISNLLKEQKDQEMTPLELEAFEKASDAIARQNFEKQLGNDKEDKLKQIELEKEQRMAQYTIQAKSATTKEAGERFLAQKKALLDQSYAKEMSQFDEQQQIALTRYHKDFMDQLRNEVALNIEAKKTANASGTPDLQALEQKQKASYVLDYIKKDSGDPNTSVARAMQSYTNALKIPEEKRVSELEHGSALDEGIALFTAQQSGQVIDKSLEAKVVNPMQAYEWLRAKGVDAGTTEKMLSFRGINAETLRPQIESYYKNTLGFTPEEIEKVITKQKEKTLEQKFMDGELDETEAEMFLERKRQLAEAGRSEKTALQRYNEGEMTPEEVADFLTRKEEYAEAGRAKKTTSTKSSSSKTDEEETKDGDVPSASPSTDKFKDALEVSKGMIRAGTLEPKDLEQFLIMKGLTTSQRSAIRKSLVAYDPSLREYVSAVSGYVQNDKTKEIEQRIFEHEKSLKLASLSGKEPEAGVVNANNPKEAQALKTLTGMKTDEDRARFMTRLEDNDPELASAVNTAMYTDLIPQAKKSAVKEVQAKPVDTQIKEYPKAFTATATAGANVGTMKPQPKTEKKTAGFVNQIADLGKKVQEKPVAKPATPTKYTAPKEWTKDNQSKYDKIYDKFVSGEEMTDEEADFYIDFAKYAK